MEVAADGPTSPMAAAGPTRRPRRPRVGRLVAAAALLAGLASTPHVVLAAVEGPDDPATHQSAGHCPCDHERAECRDTDDEVEEEREENEEAEIEDGELEEDTPMDRDADTSHRDGGCAAKASPGAGPPGSPAT